MKTNHKLIRAVLSSILPLFLCLMACDTAKLESITITPETADLMFTENVTFTATGKYDDASSRDITESVTWYSGDETIVSVKSSGLLVTRGTGTAYVSASRDDIKSQTSRVTVNMPPGLSGLEIVLGGLPELEIGSLAPISAILTFENSDFIDVGHIIYWNSSSPNVLIAEDGILNALTMGTSTVSVKLGDFSDEISINVRPIYAKISLQNNYGQDIRFEAWEGVSLYYENGIITGEAVQEKITGNIIPGSPAGETANITVQVEKNGDQIFIVTGVLKSGTAYYLSDFTVEFFNSIETTYLKITPDGVMGQYVP